MPVLQLDGYLAALIVCPETVEPSEWLPGICGGDGAFADDGRGYRRAVRAGAIGCGGWAVNAVEEHAGMGRSEMGQTTERRWHEVWREQCEATGSIRLQHGISSAFDYVVGEKLLAFAEAAKEHPEFARALPQFVSELRRMFTPEEIDEHLARIESARLQQAMDAMDVYDPELDDLAASDAEARRFESVRELLTAPALGTS